MKRLYRSVIMAAVLFIPAATSLALAGTSTTAPPASSSPSDHRGVDFTQPLRDVNGHDIMVPGDDNKTKVPLTLGMAVARALWSNQGTAAESFRDKVHRARLGTRLEKSRDAVLSAADVKVIEDSCSKIWSSFILYRIAQQIDPGSLSSQ